MKQATWPVPKLQVFGWHALAGRRRADLPCLLDLPGNLYTTSGRASITLALQALGVGPGDAVLVPSYHCPTMVAPAVQLGATPRFYGIDANGYPDLAHISAAERQGARVMLAAHFFGLPQPMAEVRRWCDRHGILLIEDCAHALFGHHAGQAVGSAGHAAIGSLTKFLPVPMGGCLWLPYEHPVPPLGTPTIRQGIKAALDIVEDGARHGRLGLLSRGITAPLNWLRRNRSREAAVLTASAGPAERESEIQLGFAIDMALAHTALPWACRIAANRLPRQRIVAQRRRNYARLVEEMTAIAGVRPLFPDLPEGAAPYVVPLWVDMPDPGYQGLRARGVPVFRWDRPWPNVPKRTGDAGPTWAHHVVQVGCHQDLSDHDLQWIVRQIRECVGHPTQASGPTPATATSHAVRGNGVPSFR